MFCSNKTLGLKFSHPFQCLKSVRLFLPMVITLGEGLSYFIPKTHPNSCFSGPKPSQKSPKKGWNKLPSVNFGTFLSGENWKSARCDFSTKSSRERRGDIPVLGPINHYTRTIHIWLLLPSLTPSRSVLRSTFFEMHTLIFISHLNELHMLVLSN